MNIQKIRNDFPTFGKKHNGKALVYFDSACVSLKPRQVIDSINKYYEDFPGCGGRSEHFFGRQVTEEMQKSREVVQRFLNAEKSEEIIFTRNTTEGINLVANSLDLKKGDIVLTSNKEHNSGLIPFQLLKEKGIKHKIFEFGNIEDFKEKLTSDIKLVSTVFTSNLDGTSNPIEEIVKTAHDNNSLILVDGAQAIPHREVNIRKLDADFLVFSGHKMLGPSGTGVLYGKSKLLTQMKPFIVGGETVKDSTYNSFSIEDLPHKFEGGLQNYAGIIGLSKAIKYLERIGLQNIKDHEKKLDKYISEEIISQGAKILGDENSENRSGIISFNIKGINHHELAGILNESSNIMIRSGMHCVHSWLNAHKIEGSARISLYLYNTKEECELLINQMEKITNLV